MPFENPKVVVVGAGAMGGLFGGLLAEGGLDVTLLDAWAEHIAAIKATGLRIVGVGGDRAIPVKATADAATARAVLGGLTAQAGLVEAPGVVRNFGDLPTTIGELAGGRSERAGEIAAAFT